jgi:hypothetical protein
MKFILTKGRKVKMREQDTCFREIEQVQVLWKSGHLFVPVFSYDILLRSMKLWKLIAYIYCAFMPGILTPVIESFAA